MGYFIFFSPDKYKEKEYKLQIELSSLKAQIQIFKDKLIYGEPSLEQDKISIISDLNIDNLSSPRIKEIIFKFSIPIQSEYSNIYRNTAIWASKWHSNEFERSSYDIYKNIFILLLYIGEGFCVWGLLLWYHSIQKPNDDELRQKSLRGELFKPCCQSCYKEILFINERGTESDGELSKLFCKDCYVNGSYIEPELTFEIASQRLSNQLDILNYSHCKKRRELKKFKRLSRWLRLTKW